MPTISILYMLTLPCDLYTCRSLLSTPHRYLHSNSLSGTIPPQLEQLTVLGGMYAPTAVLWDLLQGEPFGMCSSQPARSTFLAFSQ